MWLCWLVRYSLSDTAMEMQREERCMYRRRGLLIRLFHVFVFSFPVNRSRRYPRASNLDSACLSLYHTCHLRCASCSTLFSQLMERSPYGNLQHHLSRHVIRPITRLPPCRASLANLPQCCTRQQVEQRYAQAVGRSPRPSGAGVEKTE